MKLSRVVKLFLVAVVSLSVLLGLYAKYSETWREAIQHIFSLWLTDGRNHRDASFLNIEKVEIHAHHTNLLVKSSLTKVAKVSYVAGVFDVNKSKKTLVINEKATGKISDLNITLPKTIKLILIDSEDSVNASLDDIYVKELAVNAKNGKVQLKQFQANKAKFNLDAVDLLIQNANINSLMINALSGVISLNDTFINKAHIKNVSGDIHAAQMRVSQAIINSVSGDIHWNGYIHYADLETDSGEIYCFVPQGFHGRFKAISGSGHISKPQDVIGSDLIEVKTISGDIQLVQQ